MTYQILKNNVEIKTLNAKGMNSIYNQFNIYAKKRQAISKPCETAIGMMVWTLPNGETLALAKA
jgi:hypothetical protein